MSRKERFQFTDAILDRAIELKTTDITWPDVAQILGCSEGSLKTILGIRRKNREKPNLRESTLRRAKIKALVAERKSPSEIANILSENRGNLSTLLLKMGLNKQERVNLQAEANPRIREIIDILKKHGASQINKRASFPPKILGIVKELRKISTVSLVDISNYLKCKDFSLRQAISKDKKKQLTIKNPSQ